MDQITDQILDQVKAKRWPQIGQIIRTKYPEIHKLESNSGLNNESYNGLNDKLKKWIKSIK